MMSELENLRKENREAYAENKLLTKKAHDLELENAVLKEQLKTFTHKSTHKTGFVADLVRIAAMAASFAGIAKAVEYFK